ncbi:hypothetical protein TNCV_2939981 [Trichonephila clavipes]|nr:hypothetical protein TNCV_2939981 [Trichonephila clavipes]
MYMFEEGGACRGPAPRHLNVVENYEVCRSPFTALRKLKSKPNQNRTSWEWITKEMMMLKSEALNLMDDNARSLTAFLVDEYPKTEYSEDGSARSPELNPKEHF